MLCQTARRLLTVSNKLTVLRSTHNQIQNNVLYKCSGNRTYSSVGSGREKLEASEQDTAVAIFEKITRKDALINLLSREISTELRQNIILNPDRNSKLRHIEVTEDKIRLEYSHITPQFTKFASLMQANTEDQAQYPAFLVPSDAINLTWCGGGATLVLDKTKTLHYLRTQRALHENTASASNAHGKE